MVQSKETSVSAPSAKQVGQVAESLISPGLRMLSKVGITDKRDISGTARPRLLISITAISQHSAHHSDVVSAALASLTIQGKSCRCSRIAFTA